MRFFIYLTISALIIASGVYCLVCNTNVVFIEILNYKIHTTLSKFVLAVLLLFVLSYLLIRLLLAIVKLPKKIKEYFYKANAHTIKKQLINSFSAVLARDKTILLKNSSKLLDKQLASPINIFLYIQAKILSGHIKTAQELVTKLATEGFLYNYSLMHMALYQHEHLKAVTYGEKAVQAMPHSILLRDKLVQSYICLQDYNNAIENLNILITLHQEKDYTDLKGQLLTKIAQEKYQQKDFPACWDLINEAITLGYQTYNVLLLFIKVARLLNKLATVYDTFIQAWNQKPRFSLIIVYFNAKGAETDQDKLQAVAEITKKNPDNPASILLLARFSLQARLYENTKKYLNLLDKHSIYQEQRYRLLARLALLADNDKLEHAKYNKLADEVLELSYTDANISYF